MAWVEAMAPILGKDRPAALAGCAVEWAERLNRGWETSFGLPSFAAALASLTGWQRWRTACLFGAVSALALPPVGFVPALFISFPALVWLVDGTATRRAAFAAGWWFGFGYFVAGLHWIASAYLTEAGGFTWQILASTICLPAYQALYPAFAIAFARWMRPGCPRVAGLALAWAVLETIRGFGDFSFPWNPIGSAWTDIPAMMQPAAVVGVHGLGGLTVAVAAAPALLAAGGRAAVAVALGAPLALALVWGAGALRLERAAGDAHPEVVMGIVQPNIPPLEKAGGALADARRHLARHLRMTEAAARSGATHVVWPETAIDGFFVEAPDTNERVAQAAPKDGLVIAGTVRLTPVGEQPVGIWNSLVAIDRQARSTELYDKARLVPFREYWPLRSMLIFFGVFEDVIEFDRGAGPRTLRMPGLPPFSPSICYEIVYSGRIVAPGARPEWILNVTNDGWFGDTAGPYQHFAAARMRAVEEGLPVVRAANTGISGVIDPYGRVIERLGIGRDGPLLAALPAAPPAPPPFALLGPMPVLVAMMLAAAVLAALKRTQPAPDHQVNRAESVLHPSVILRTLTKVEPNVPKMTPSSRVGPGSPVLKRRE